MLDGAKAGALTCWHAETDRRAPHVLVVDAGTAYRGDRRRADRCEVWERTRAWTRGGFRAPVCQDPVGRPRLALRRAVPATPSTWPTLATPGDGVPAAVPSSSSPALS